MHGLPNGTPFAAQEDNRGTSYHPDPVPLSIPKQRTKITCPCANPFRHLARATPKTTRKPFQGHGRRRWPRPPWPLQRSAERPRRHGRAQPPDAAQSCLGTQDTTRKAGCCGCRGETKPKRSKWDVSPGLLGKYFWIGHRQKICQADTLGVMHWGENKSYHRKSVMLHVCLNEILQAVAAYFHNIMCRMYSVSCQVQ